MTSKERERYVTMLEKAKTPGSGCSEGYIEHIEKILAGEAEGFLYQPYAFHGMDAYMKEQEEQRKQTQQFLEENVRKLDECGGHDFKEIPLLIDIPVSIFMYNWQCALCHGVVQDIQKEWYEKGATHAYKKVEHVLDARSEVYE